MDDITFGFSRTERAGVSASVGPKGSIEFDVDDDGNVVLVLGNEPMTIDDAAAWLLRLVFQCVC